MLTTPSGSECHASVGRSSSATLGAATLATEHSTSKPFGNSEWEFGLGIVFVNELQENKGKLLFTPAYEDYLRKKLMAETPRDRDGWISPSSVLECPTAAVHQLN